MRDRRLSPFAEYLVSFWTWVSLWICSESQKTLWADTWLSLCLQCGLVCWTCILYNIAASGLWQEVWKSREFPYNSWQLTFIFFLTTKWNDGWGIKLVIWYTWINLRIFLFRHAYLTTLLYSLLLLNYNCSSLQCSNYLDSK
jgi:hypothetical protein